MTGLIYAVFSGVQGHAELQWHGSSRSEAQRGAIANYQLDPKVSIRVLPLGWQWEKTVFQWEDLPGFDVPIAKEGGV